jgi:hypothetical protein
MNGGNKAASNASGSMWRSSAAGQKEGIRGYGDNVVNRLNEQKLE